MALTLPLLALLAVECYMAALPTALPSALPLAPAAAQTADALQLPDLHGTDAAILARPLFSPSRRPAAQPGPAAAGELPRLSGIMISNAGKFAIFSPASGKTIIAATGDQVGAYTVGAIGAGGVTVFGPQGAITLQTSFAGAGTSPAAPPAAPATLAAPTQPVTLLGGITLQSPNKGNLPSAANWPGVTHIEGLSATQSTQLAPVLGK